MITLATAFTLYLVEHVRPLGQDVRRVVQTYGTMAAFFGRDADPTTFRRSHYRDYTAARLGKGVAESTVRRELSVFQAVMNHHFREERVPSMCKVPLPPSGAARRRFLSKEEFARVLAQPMSERLRMFFAVAIQTGARAQAIEELTWDRVDFRNGLVDFRVPGRRITRKRRAIVPMSRELRRILEAADAKPHDEYVIGAGNTTYHEAKAVMRSAGINEAGVARHVCRKSFASWRLQSGQPIAHVAALIGDSTTTTERAYAFVLPEHLRDAVEAG